MSAAAKPIPVPSVENAPYWEGAQQHKLVLPRCTTCGWYFAQPQIICSNCRGEAFAWSQTSGNGKIYSYTIVYQTATPGFQAEIPYVIVHVSIDELPECVITANLVGENIAFENLDIDLPVVVDFEERGGITLPQFRLA